MLPETIADFGEDYRNVGDQLLFKSCPVCGSQRSKTYLNPDTGGWWCYAAEHGAGGWVQVSETAEAAGARLLSRLRPAPPRQSREWPQIGLPPYQTLSKNARLYLLARDVHADDSKKLMLVESSNYAADQAVCGRILIPHTNLRGEIIYWTGRSYATYARGPKYYGAGGQKPLYVPEHGLGSGPHRQLVVVEGPFDAIAVWQAGYVAVAIGGKSLPRYMEEDLRSMVLPEGEIVIMLDQSALVESLRLQRQLEGAARRVRIVTPSREDPGAMSSDQIRNAIG